ncbi:MAG TPA: PilX N-terminal domain-containing pilus assembly protein [Steroidobacteraceae bacterium]|nr:PilX N-terminal domain-containing pilus assembly protein [Steroidobacteraceae bacterium]
MSSRLHQARVRERGIVLISSLLLLLVVTILALAMFRSMGLAEKIAGNVREKQRALHSAMLAEQYAEWWLSSGNASQSPVVCNNVGAATDQNWSQVLICSNPINPAPVTGIANPGAVPWTDGGGNQLGFTYTLPTGSTQMNFTADSNGSYSNSYYTAPYFYIQYVGIGADGGGSVFKIDALGYGGTPLSVAVVESMYEIGSQGRDAGQE